MKIHITEGMMRRTTPRPTQPAVSLSHEAYEALLVLSDKHNVSMRRLANMIILEACENLEVKTDED